MRIESLYFYPIKSFRGVAVEELDIDAQGPRHDRQFMLVDENNKFVGPEGGDFRAQCVKAFENLTVAIKAAGASWADVVKINNYLIDIEKNIGAFREVRDTFLNTKAPPASTTIGVPALARPGGLFEIEAIAVVGKKKDKKKKK